VQLAVCSVRGVLAAAFGLGEGGLFTSRCLVGQPFFVVRVVSAFALPAQVDLVVGWNDTLALRPNYRLLARCLPACGG
jgi:hypothetical protein